MRAGFGTLLHVLQHLEQVVKASSGHIPLPFLISDAQKNWCKDRVSGFELPNKFFFRCQNPALGGALGMLWLQEVLLLFPEN